MGTHFPYGNVAGTWLLLFIEGGGWQDWLTERNITWAFRFFGGEPVELLSQRGAVFAMVNVRAACRMGWLKGHHVRSSACWQKPTQ